jgi:preprotein translocase subunit SecG
MIVRFLLGLFLVLSSLFLILLVLIQRGRGGGLAGAFGGAGGQSAFGTKAGDVFTKITIGVAAFWILLCILALNVLGRPESKFDAATLGGSAPIDTGSPAGAAPAPGGEAPKTDSPAGSGLKAGTDTPAATATPPAATGEATPAGETSPGAAPAGEQAK